MQVVRTRGRTAGATYKTDKCVTLARVRRHAASAGWQRRILVLKGSMHVLLYPVSPAIRRPRGARGESSS